MEKSAPVRPPGSPTTSLTQLAANGATSLKVVALTKAVAVGDTIFLGWGPNAQTVTATAAAPIGATTITVRALTASAANLTSVYDSSLTTVPNTIPTTVNSSSSGTTLHVNALQSPVASGDTIVVGTGASAQTVTAGNNYGNGTTTMTVSALSGTVSSGTSVYDTTCSATQLSQIQGVALNLQATKNPGGQPTGYQSLAYLFSPGYSTAVG